MTRDDRITPRQFVATAFLSVLSPMIRRFPRVLAETAGRSAWLSAPLTILPAAAGVWLARRLFRGTPPGQGYAEVMERTLGRTAGRILTAIYGIWMLCYAGFLLRSGAIRFQSTVYADTSLWIFVVPMVILCIAAASGTFLRIARCAMALRPLLVAGPVLIVVLTVKDLDLSLLVPIRAGDLPSIGYGALKLANLLSVSFFLSFAGGRMQGEPLRARTCFGWIAAALGLMTLITAGCFGMFGAELTKKLSYPFFMLALDATALGALERIEPAVVALWVFTDFIIISALFWIAARILLSFFSAPSGPPEPRRRRTAACAAGALAAAAAFGIPEQEHVFFLLSEHIVPLGNAALTFAVPLLLLCVKTLRNLP